MDDFSVCFGIIASLMVRKFKIRIAIYNQYERNFINVKAREEMRYSSLYR